MSEFKRAKLNGQRTRGVSMSQRVHLSLVFGALSTLFAMIPTAWGATWHPQQSWESPILDAYWCGSSHSVVERDLNGNLILRDTDAASALRLPNELNGGATPLCSADGKNLLGPRDKEISQFSTVGNKLSKT